MSFPNPLLFPPDDQKISRICKIFDYPARITILRELINSDGLFVHELENRIPLSQSTISEHLEKLREAELVDVILYGSFNRYVFSPGTMRHMLSELTMLMSALAGQPAIDQAARLLNMVQGQRI